MKTKDLVTIAQNGALSPADPGGPGGWLFPPRKLADSRSRPYGQLTGIIIIY
eukprot:COSAG05_NODE_71_length_22071_cov_17.527149_21_plen_52_part_00